MTNALIDKVTFMTQAEAAYSRLTTENEIKTCTCFKCSKVVEYKEIGYERDFLGNAPVYTINLGRGTYGSGFFDGCDIYMEVCNSCMVGFVKGFSPEGLDSIEYSGVHYPKEIHEAISQDQEEYQDLV